MKLQKLVVSELIQKAQSYVGAVIQREKNLVLSGDLLTNDLQRVEFDFDETLEYSAAEYSFNGFLKNEELFYSAFCTQKQPIIICIDTSLSMTGKKLALTAIALAIVLIHFKDYPISLIAFENEAEVLVEAYEKLPIEEWIRRFLEVPASGYTHLEKGVRLALQKSYQMRQLGLENRQKDPAVILVTDGKYTAGKDPTYLAKKFGKLNVLQMGSERGGDELCRNLAKYGNGSLYRVDKLELLPQVMYRTVKDILRGAR